MGMQMKQPVIMDTITLPCLRILQQLVKPDGGASKKVRQGNQESNEVKGFLGVKSFKIVVFYHLLCTEIEFVS
jgi:hypothetical protein